MPLHHIQNNYITVTYRGQLGDWVTAKYSDTLWNRVNMLNDKSIKDIMLQSGQYIKKDFKVIHINGIPAIK